MQVYNFFHPLILSNDADILKISEGGTAEFTLDNPNGIETLQFFSDLYNKHGVVMIPSANDEYNWLAAPKAFAQGKVAMFYGQPWDGVDIKKEMKTEYGFVLFPKGPKAQDNIVPIRNESKIYVMPKGAKHPKEAAKIFEELMSFNKETDFLAFKEWMGNGLYSDKYLATVDKMVDKGRLSSAGGFQIFENSLQNMIINDLIKSNTPADVFVKDIKDDCQKAIDEEF